jgi:hypothetical protein
MSWQNGHYYKKKKKRKDGSIHPQSIDLMPGPHTKFFNLFRPGNGLVFLKEISK